MTSEFLESVIRAQAIELVNRDVIIKAQAGVINAINNEAQAMKDGGKALAEMLLALYNRYQNLAAVSTIRNRIWQIIYTNLKKDYNALIELFGKNGGGGQMTNLRADYFIDYMVTADPRTCGIVRAGGEVYLTFAEITHKLYNEVPDYLRLSPLVRNVYQAIANVCKRILTRARKRGINIMRLRKGFGMKVWVLVYKLGPAPKALPSPADYKKKTRKKTLREALDNVKQPQEWARNYSPFFREVDATERSDLEPKMSQEDMFAKWSGGS